MSIYREYDIRGIYPKELDENTALLIGKALGKGFTKFVVGRDNRRSSESLTKPFIKGLINSGAHVTDVGLSLTPIIHFLTCTQDFDFGVIVTASHNPKEYNGFRIDYKNARPFFGEDIKKLEGSVLKAGFTAENGAYEKKDLFGTYKDFLNSRFAFKKNFKIAVNTGNGAAGKFYPEVLRSLGCEVVVLDSELNGNFPNGVPNPENTDFMKKLSAFVSKNKSDLGLGFDTDGDRIGVVDEKGKVYEADKLLLLFADEFLKASPGERIVFDVKCTGLAEKAIREKGGVPKRIRTGHSFFMEELENGALMGCEYSGHFFFKDYFGYDDGLYTACKLIKILEEKKLPLSQIMSEFPKTFHTNEIKIPYSDDSKSELVENLRKSLKGAGLPGFIDDTDGVRYVIEPTSWFLIRASNTNPYLSVRIEATDGEKAGILVELVNTTLKKLGVNDYSVKESDFIEA